MVSPARNAGPLKIGLFLAGLALLVVGLVIDWASLLTVVGLPSGELRNPWVQGELITLRRLSALAGALLTISLVLLERYPLRIAGLSERLQAASSTAAHLPWFVPLCLLALITTKTALQLGLYFVGYTNYAADDFSRTLRASYWEHYRRFDLGMGGWLGLAGSGWLPFSDYLVGPALAVNGDLFLTPKVVNLVISAVAIVAVYLLGRQLFGRAVGLVTAALFALQPWQIWLGISGMTSDLPSVTLIAVFGTFLARWLQTNQSLPLLAAAATLAVANGFRYENWFFTVMFALLILWFAVTRHEPLRRPRVLATIGALALLAAFPIFWMGANYVTLGYPLPAVYTNNVSAVPLRMGLPLLVIGAFPIELALSIAGALLSLRSAYVKTLRPYLWLVAGAFLPFCVLFRGQLEASIVIARYLLPYVVLLLPCASFLLVELARAVDPWRNERLLAAAAILLLLGTLDLRRMFNYPVMFPKDAIQTGLVIRSLQKTGTIGDREKILIERADDWGDIGVVVLASRPERFVALNESTYRRAILSKLPGGRAVSAVAQREDGVRGSVCDGGFQAEPCQDSVRREQFRLVILSSPGRVASFEETFHVRSWSIGRYHIFDMRLVPISSLTSCRCPVPVGAPQPKGPAHLHSETDARSRATVFPLASTARRAGASDRTRSALLTDRSRRLLALEERALSEFSAR